MSLTISGQIELIAPSPIKGGLSYAVSAMSQNATVTSFTAACPFTTLYDVQAHVYGTTDPTTKAPVAQATMSALGTLSIVSGAVTFAKNSSTQQDYHIQWWGT